MTSRLVLPLALILVLATGTALAGDPSPLEDRNFLLETGWNRDDAVLQSNSFFLYGRNAFAYELTQEWAAGSSRHQLSYTIPLFTDEATGLGDVTFNYRFQLAGDADSRVGVAPRLTVLFPTRSAQFGGKSSGIQFGLPMSVNLTPRLTSHTNAIATWYRERGESELAVAQSIVFNATSHVAFALDASYTRCAGVVHPLVFRPGVQFAIDGPGGLQFAPGVALALVNGAGDRSLLVYVALEQRLH